ncbi:Short chain dehydrogenase [Lasiodiplodia theobromae]|uniref:L-xylulose reductase n=1 Tax=Lasiodiplodia theobromae TaxID=45133 RepID=A0A5N5DLX4_9PEZI|nr:Short chain dehydrogenase [Lasiodiplodia theobromae]KAB2578928.1 L-xylulose reductase [Lasiodiplodia theobromae]KAF4545206.1 Short chain dehydrogenase [Lasiodiplodia theobromae]
MGDNTTTTTPAAAPLVARPLEGKLGIISGGSRGIGAAVARSLAAKGCSLVLNHTSAASEGRAAALAQELRDAHGVAATAVRADISEESGCAAIIDAARSIFKGGDKLRIDVLINNAAVQTKAYLGEIKPEEFWNIYKINVLGTVLLTQAVLPFLPWDRSGRIVNMSSVTNSNGMAGYSIYGGTKGAVESMTRVWARELAERATVNTVNIGPTMTDMYQDIPVEVLADVLKSWFPTAPLSAVREQDSERAKYFAKELGGRPGYPEEVAGVVTMLCLPESGWSTGGLIDANGGGRVGY